GLQVVRIFLHPTASTAAGPAKCTARCAMHEPISFGSDERGFVYAIARRIVGSPEEADDVTQDALLTAFRNRDAFRGEAKYRTWLYRIALTAALGHLRRRSRSREALAANDVEVGHHVPDGAPSA